MIGLGVFLIYVKILRSSASIYAYVTILQGLQPTKRDAYGRLILGDIITSVNGRKVTNGSDLYRILDQCKVGEQVSFFIQWPLTDLFLLLVGEGCLV